MTRFDHPVKRFADMAKAGRTHGLAGAPDITRFERALDAAVDANLQLDLYDLQQRLERAINIEQNRRGRAPVKVKVVVGSGKVGHEYDFIGGYDPKTRDLDFAVARACVAGHGPRFQATQQHCRAALRDLVLHEFIHVTQFDAGAIEQPHLDYFERPYEVQAYAAIDEGVDLFLGQGIGPHPTKKTVRKFRQQRGRFAMQRHEAKKGRK